MNPDPDLDLPWSVVGKVYANLSGADWDGLLPRPHDCEPVDLGFEPPWTRREKMNDAKKLNKAS